MSSRSIVASIGTITACGAALSSVRRLPSAVVLAELRPEFQPTSLAIAFQRFFSSANSDFSSARSADNLACSPLDLHLLELAQAAQPQVQDRFGLDVGEFERVHQTLAWAHPPCG